MPVRVALNGFGRIGRNTFKVLWEKYPQLQVAAISVTDPHVTETRALLLKYDSTHGVFPPSVEARVEGRFSSLIVDGRLIPVIARGGLEKLPWHQMGIDIVVEATGYYRDGRVASGHLRAGARKVILTAPPKPLDSVDLVVVMGVNESSYDPERHHIISNTSCTTNCLAPVARVLHEEFGIAEGLLTTVHSYTSSQRLTDKTHTDPRRARAAGLSIIPTSTGAAQMVGVVMPELEGRFDGTAIRVPTPAVSLVDFTVRLERPASAEEINQAFRDRAQGDLKGILGLVNEPLVSVDFRKDPRSAVVDGLLTMTAGSMAKVFAWYDNEWGYSHRVADFASYMSQSDAQLRARLDDGEEQPAERVLEVSEERVE